MFGEAVFPVKTEVRFRSTVFNCSAPRENFLNEGCFGEDVCRWLIRQLRARGVRTAHDPVQEDFGWYFAYCVGGAEHCFVVSFQPNDPGNGDEWIGWVERSCGFFGSLFGPRWRSIYPEAVHIVDVALRSSPDVQHVTWYDAVL